MIENHYPIFKKLIDEFERDKAIFSSNKEIFSYYPQLFLLAIVSTFEKEIKEQCNNIITHPSVPLVSLPQLHKIITGKALNYSDEIYKKFKAREKNGIITLDATAFYNIFGGASFRNDIETHFNTERQNQISDYSSVIFSLTPLMGKGDKYDSAYAENDDIYNRLKALKFSDAEVSFLKLKMQRNKVAHNFLTGISDSFEDIRNLYYDAVLYVVALKQALKDLSTI